MSSDDKHIRSMRWLYEDEKSYRKAAAKLKLEELKAQREKALIRQYRKRQRRIWLGKAETTLRPFALKLKKKAHRTNRKQLAYGLSAAAVIGAVWGGSQLFWHTTKSNEQPKTLGAASVTPDFNPATPAGSDQSVSTTETNHHKIVTYQDTVAGSALIVSQQKLPDSFKNDQQAITKLDQFKTAEPLDTPKGKLYVTTNNTGQQWAAMTYQDILIFFQTNKRITFDEWYKYIKDLTIK